MKPWNSLPPNRGSGRLYDCPRGGGQSKPPGGRPGGRAGLTGDPMTHELDNVHEIVGTGTLFPDDEGKPMLHMHVASGRRDSTITGCVRTGVKVWQVAEVVLIELLDTTAVRKLEPALGFKLLTTINNTVQGIRSTVSRYVLTPLTLCLRP